MATTWTLGPFLIQSTLALAFISLGAGLLFFRLYSPFSKNETKELVDSVFNLFGSFIIGLWIAKGLINLKLLFKSPIAVLAYPADKKVFYTALVLFVLWNVFQYIMKPKRISETLIALLYTLIVAQFVYAFLNIVIQDYLLYMSSAIVFAVVLLLVVMLQQKIRDELKGSLTFIAFTIANLVVAYFNSVSFFNFYVDLSFWVILFVTSIVIYVIRIRLLKRLEADRIL